MHFRLFLAIAISMFLLIAPEFAKADGWEKILTSQNENSASGDTALDCVRPTPQQLRTQNWQMGAFLHFGLPTWAKTPAEYASVFPDTPGMPDASRFDPKELDAEQWVLTAKSFGAKYFVFTTKHHDGFCLWPTKTTEYCVRNTPWKNGKGDVVAEVAKACKKHGLPLALYCSPADKDYGCYSTPGKILVGGREKYEQYWKVYEQQLTELMTNYGELVEFWFDGNRDPFGCNVVDPETGKKIGSEKARAIVDLVHKLQPNAIVIQGEGGVTSGMRWTGSEDGKTNYPLWNVIRKGEGKKYWLADDAQGWFIPQSNYHPRPDWLWQPGSDAHLASVDRLVESYYTSIGNGANLLLNLTPDTRGLIPELEVKRMAELGAELKRRFGKPLATTASGSDWATPGELELDLGRPCLITDIVLEEEIAKGQHVLVYDIDVFDGKEWKTVVKGQSIGRKHISQMKPAVTGEKVRLRIIKANAIPMIRTLAAFGKASDK